MLKIVKLISLCLLASVIAEISVIDIPPHLLCKTDSIHQVVVTAYTDNIKCVGSAQFKTSSSHRLSAKDYNRLIALSHDLAKGYDFGDEFKLYVKGKTYEVTYRDRMPKKHRSKVDLLLPSMNSCREFGRKTGILIPLDKA